MKEKVLNSKLLADTIRLVKSLEWSSYAEGPGSSMGATDGVRYPACPRCGGINPKSGAEREFTSSAIGHKPRCALARSLKGLK